jgi:hypothetical protein
MPGAYDGSEIEVYEEDRTTFARWRELEPQNVRGLRGRHDPEGPIYAVLVRGSFSVAAPPGPEGSTTDVPFDEARIIVDRNGDFLSIRPWDGAPDKGRGEPFGEHFDEE